MGRCAAEETWRRRWSITLTSGQPQVVGWRPEDGETAEESGGVLQSLKTRLKFPPALAEG